ncbi:hypothetical protein BY996DRAFT_6408975 [Phakopsora pachyrhizi]|nr:hypothetical protein BY996DRAFT_6408975 [Phakopsora pachyrhizi]
MTSSAPTLEPARSTTMPAIAATGKRQNVLSPNKHQIPRPESLENMEDPAAWAWFFRETREWAEKLALPSSGWTSWKGRRNCPRRLTPPPVPSSLAPAPDSSPSPAANPDCNWNRPGLWLFPLGLLAQTPAPAALLPESPLVPPLPP